MLHTDGTTMLIHKPTHNHTHAHTHTHTHSFDRGDNSSEQGLIQHSTHEIDFEEQVRITAYNRYSQEHRCLSIKYD